MKDDLVEIMQDEGAGGSTITSPKGSVVSIYIARQEI